MLIFEFAYRQGLPMCAGQLGVRVPKQGGVTEYKTFEVPSTLHPEPCTLDPEP